MIIGTFDKEEVGNIIQGWYRLTQDEDRYITIYILRVATYGEWQKYRKEQGRPLNTPYYENANFYEVSTD